MAAHIAAAEDPHRYIYIDRMYHMRMTIIYENMRMNMNHVIRNVWQRLKKTFLSVSTEYFLSQHRPLSFRRSLFLLWSNFSVSLNATPPPPMDLAMAVQKKDKDLH
jgi:Cft2 family RNA processing exonuclease